MRVLALDPGTIHNAWAVVEEAEGRLFVVEHASLSVLGGGRQEVVGVVEAMVVQAVERHGPHFLLVELPKGRKPSVPRKVWRELQGIVQGLAARLSAILPVFTKLLSRMPRFSNRGGSESRAKLGVARPSADVLQFCHARQPHAYRL